MTARYLPREWVHETSEAIGDRAVEEQAALQRLLKEQRRLTRWLEENTSNLEPASGSVAVYLFGVVTRMFDLAGGRLRKATWEQVRATETQIGRHAAGLLPFDDGFPDRVRAVEGRAQPHILDEALMNLFEREAREDEADLGETESGKVFFLLWVATEVLDRNWKPGNGPALTDDASYVHIDPPTPDDNDDGEHSD